MTASDRELLSALLEHDSSGWIPEAHDDDCTAVACTGCADRLPEGWLPNGGHDSLCGYASGITGRCTCKGVER